MKFLSLILVLGYLLLTSFFFYHANGEQLHAPLKPFFLDDNARHSLEYSFAYDTSDHSLLVVRLVHNKLETIVHTFFSTVVRIVDIPFLFGLSKTVSSPYQIDYRPSPLFLVELPFFVISLVYFFKNFNNQKSVLRIFSLFFIGSILIVGAFSPSLHPLTMLPFILTLRAFIGVGVIRFVRRNG